MSDKMLVDSQRVPDIYQKDPLLNVTAEYQHIMLAKHDGSEKEIAQVYLSRKSSQNRVGWLIPVLSLISTEHDFAEDKYFQKHAYEIFKKVNGDEFYENTYILIVSERLWFNLNGNLEKESLFVALAEFGLYPWSKDDLCVTYKNKLAHPIEKEIVLDLSFSLENNSDGYIASLLHNTLKYEENEYARFMYIYQFFELTMEFIFYREMTEYRKNKNHLGTIRDKFTKLSSESKLITLIYDRLNLNELDAELNNKVKNVFFDYKDDDYYKNSNKATVIYDIRNSLVHSYFRFNLKSELGFLCDYLEMELYEILKALYKDEEFKIKFKDEYL